MIDDTISVDSGIKTSVTSANGHEIHIMVITVPNTINNELVSRSKVCIRVWETLSMSLMTRESGPPRGYPSEYDGGRRCSLTSMSLHIHCIDFWATPISN